MITSTSDWMERHAFSAVDKGVRTVAAEPIAGRLLQIELTTLLTSLLEKVIFGLVCLYYLSLDIRLVVWRKFHFFCGTAVSAMCVT